MREITSTKNSEIISVSNLKDKSYRKESGKYIIEGDKMIKDAISLGKKFEMIYVAKSHFELFKDMDNVTLVSDTVMKKISDTVTPQGVLGVLKIPKYEVENFSKCVILDNIQDAGNLGTIIRTMAALSVEYLFLCDCADAFSPKTVRSSMSGIHFVRCFDTDKNHVVEMMKTRGVPIITADMHGEDACGVRSDNFALVIGNEAHGVSDAFKTASDRLVSIKISNVESLNAGVAASIILYMLTK